MLVKKSVIILIPNYQKVNSHKFFEKSCAKVNESFNLLLREKSPNFHRI